MWGSLGPRAVSIRWVSRKEKLVLLALDASAGKNFLLLQRFELSHNTFNSSVSEGGWHRQ